MKTEEMIEKIVKYMIDEGAKETTQGDWIFYWSYLEHKFSLPDGWLAAYVQEIEDEIYKYECVSDVIIENDHSNKNFCFDINFYTDFCPNFEEWEV